MITQLLLVLVMLFGGLGLPIQSERVDAGEIHYGFGHTRHQPRMAVHKETGAAIPPAAVATGWHLRVLGAEVPQCRGDPTLEGAVGSNGAEI
jgi:hypothetical protein